MSKTFDDIKQLVSAGEVRISDHGYDELAEDDILARDILDHVDQGRVVEDTRHFRRGRRYWCYNRTQKAAQYMWCGAYRKGTIGRRFW